MKTSSKKSKGRRLQNYVRDTLRKLFSSRLEDDDIKSQTMGMCGEDIVLSPAAKKMIPYSFECKNKEGFKGIYDIIFQAQSNSKATDTPVAIIKMNKFQPLAIVDATHFLKLIGKQNG